MVKTSLQAAEAMHLAYKNSLSVPLEVLGFVKNNIRTHNPDHLSAMIYYSALAGCFDNDLWGLYEMQIARTNICKTMSLVSLLKTCEGFALRPGDNFEVFDRAQGVLDEKIDLEMCGVKELGSFLYCFTIVDHVTKPFFDKLIGRVYDLRKDLTCDLAVKVLWSLSVCGYKGHLSRFCVKIIEENKNALSPCESRHFRWALSNLR